MIRVFAAAAVLLLVAPAAEAQERRPRSISEEVDRCPDQTNPGMMGCAAVALQREDGRLNRVYKAALARLTPSRQAVLRAEQRQWIKDRDAQCQEEQDMGGAQAGVYAMMCQATATRDRADVLTRWR